MLGVVYVRSAMEQKYSSSQSKTTTDKCCLCDEKVKGAVLLCVKHWKEYSRKAKGDFKKFQEYRKKIESGLIKQKEH